MKFDFIIGNPPYQEETNGASTSDKPLYDRFMDSVYKVGDKVELITPARFLFEAGATPAAWNRKMLDDEHFKVLFYEKESKNIFSNTSIVGGVAITYRDSETVFGKIGTFTAFQELNTILRKVIYFPEFEGLASIIYTQNKFDLDVLNREIPSLNRTDKRLESNIFQLKIFTKEQISPNDIKVIGLSGAKREYRYVNKKYIDVEGSVNLYKYKVLISKSNGASGTLGGMPARMITVPFLAEPSLGYTRTFIGIGAFNTEVEAKAALKYIKCKFCRAMLGVLKVTQDNNPDKWKYVPLQDFTHSSDIDWSKSIKEIDAQLYAKYGLDENEINFIESHVKEME